MKTNFDYSVPSPSVIKQTGVHMEFLDGVARMVAADRPFWGLMYTFDPYEERPYLEAVRSMYKQGIRLFSFLVPLPIAWLPGGEYDFTLLDHLHDEILNVAPDALLFPRVFLTTPSWWDEEHPDELIGFRGEIPKIDTFPHEHQTLWRYETKMYHSPNNPSLASHRWQKDASNALAAYVKHTWSEKYAGHFFGYQVAYGTCGEWGAFGSYKNNRFGSYDFSKPMIHAFQDFLRNKYETESALQQAWQQPEITFETAEPPSKIQKLRTSLGVLKDPLAFQCYADWVDCYSLLLYKAITCFCQIAKQSAPVPVLSGGFCGYNMQVGCSAYITHLAQTKLRSLLQNNDIDIVSTPNWYENRETGISSSACVATVARHKIFMAECDVLIHLSGMPQYARTSQERLNFFKRDTFYNLTQGSGHLWWYDFGNGWYRDDAIEECIAGLVRCFKSIPPVRRSSQAEVAFVVDEESIVYTEGSMGYFKLVREFINQQLPQMGAPFDVITTEDLFERSPYKFYIFRDMFYVTDRKIKKLREFLEHANASCLWFFAAGLLGDSGININRCHRLTRIRLNLLDFSTSQQLTVLNFDHPITRGVGQTVGTSGNEDLRGVYGPMLYVDDAQAEVLGQIESVEKPGIAVKKQGSRFDAWCASPLLPAQMVANLSKEAGIHRYLDPGTVMFGSGRLICLQSDISKMVDFRPKDEIKCLMDVLTGQVYPCAGGLVKIHLTAGEPMLLLINPSKGKKQ